MSYLTFKSIKTYNKLPNVSGNLQKGDEPGFLRTGQVPWDPVISSSILHWLCRIEWPYRTYRNVPFPEPYRSAIYRFQIALDAYLESENPVIPVSKIIEIAVMRDSAEILKRIRFKSLLESGHSKPIEEPDWYKETIYYNIKSIGDIFNYRWLIFWEIPDEKDYEWGFRPLKVDSLKLEKYKATLTHLLEKVRKPKVIPEEEVQLSLSGSISLSKDGKKIPHWKAKEGNIKSSESMGVALRTVVPVAPGEIRDTVILSPGDLQRVQWIDLQVTEILKDIPGNLYLKGVDLFEKRINNFFKKFKIYIQRDIKKEGITKPRELLKATLEVLKEKFPELQAFEFPDFFSTFRLQVDNEILHPERGHGLGMANGLTTLIQLALVKMVHTMTQEEEYTGGEIGVLSLNDDIIIGFSSEDDLESYFNKEMEYLSDLGILHNYNKSFISRDWGVICEEYRGLPDFSQKESYRRWEVLLAFALSNITQAKYHINSLNLLDNEYIECYLEEIISFWGYEFFPEEVNYPFRCGGWKTSHILGVSLDLIDLERLPYSTCVYNAFKACQREVPKRVKKKKKKTSYLPPVIQLFGNPRNDLQRDKYLNLLSIEDMEEKFYKTSNPASKIGYWIRLHKERVRTYKRKLQKPFELFIDEIFKSSNEDFLPIQHMIEKYVDIDYVEDYEDRKNSKNPLISYIGWAFGRPIQDFHPERFSMLTGSYLDFSQLSDLLKVKIEKLNRLFRDEEINFIPGGFVPYPLDRRAWRYFNQPVLVAHVIEVTQFKGSFPILKEKYERDYLREREEFFGINLYPNEEMTLLNFLSRGNVKRFLKVYQISPEENNSIIEEIYDLVNDIITQVEETKEALQPENEDSKELILIPEEPKKPLERTLIEGPDGKEYYLDPVAGKQEIEIFNPWNDGHFMDYVTFRGYYLRVPDRIQEILDYFNDHIIIEHVVSAGSPQSSREEVESFFDSVASRFEEPWVQRIKAWKQRFCDFVFKSYIDNLDEDEDPFGGLFT